MKTLCEGRFTSGIHMSPSTRRKAATTCTGKDKETTAHSNPLGDLDKTRNEPISDFHRVPLPLLAKLIPHLLVLCYGPRVSNSCGVSPPRDPGALCSEHRTGLV